MGQGDVFCVSRTRGAAPALNLNRAKHVPYGADIARSECPLVPINHCFLKNFSFVTVKEI